MHFFDRLYLFVLLLSLQPRLFPFFVLKVDYESSDKKAKVKDKEQAENKYGEIFHLVEHLLVVVDRSVQELAHHDRRQEEQELAADLEDALRLRFEDPPVPD